VDILDEMNSLGKKLTKQLHWQKLLQQQLLQPKITSRDKTLGMSQIE
jgi:hypothetical protein